MKQLTPLNCTALAVPLLLIGAAPSHAAGTWRCDDDPGEPECEEALLNDIEDIIVEDWPTLELAMPSIPYWCTKEPGSGREMHGEEGEITPQFTNQINWSVKLTGDLRSFLFGRHTAASDYLGPIRLRASTGEFNTSWSSQVINYVFLEGTTEVMAQGGSTGVYDLGAIDYSTASGALWTADLPITLELADGDWTCTIGPPGNRITRTGRNIVHADYPVQWTPVKSVIAEAVRGQFRRAVRIAVTGAP